MKGTTVPNRGSSLVEMYGQRDKRSYRTQQITVTVSMWRFPASVSSARICEVCSSGIALLIWPGRRFTFQIGREGLKPFG